MLLDLKSTKSNSFVLTTTAIVFSSGVMGVFCLTLPSNTLLINIAAIIITTKIYFFRIFFLPFLYPQTHHHKFSKLTLLYAAKIHITIPYNIKATKKAIVTHNPSSLSGPVPHSPKKDAQLDS
ncbi:exported hypothetical protein [Candidatus Desulfosporosinus infrequens]|uniref:Uncharacterized protein n=1 Tax=Candidatus Desulfosporosinus infrequens TaxID=2043169 RepID=A0A2U3LIG3_9FIRM|nr:exported hypothetical protein [Candidatus Desulfosporosinus infrequens]